MVQSFLKVNNLQERVFGFLSHREKRKQPPGKIGRIFWFLWQVLLNQNQFLEARAKKKKKNETMIAYVDVGSCNREKSGGSVIKVASQLLNPFLTIFWHRFVVNVLYLIIQEKGFNQPTKAKHKEREGRRKKKGEAERREEETVPTV